MKILKDVAISQGMYSLKAVREEPQKKLALFTPTFDQSNFLNDRCRVWRHFVTAVLGDAYLISSLDGMASRPRP